jgi:hypothetical protein
MSHQRSGYREVHTSIAPSNLKHVEERTGICSTLVSEFLTNVLHQKPKYTHITLSSTVPIQRSHDATTIPYTLASVKKIDEELFQLVRDHFHETARLEVVNGWGELDNMAMRQRECVCRIVIFDSVSLVNSERAIALDAWKRPALLALVFMILALIVWYRLSVYWSQYVDPLSNYRTSVGI